MPNESPNDFLRLLSALTAARVEFAVVGGVAAVLHGASTATYDLDILMPFTVENCEHFLAAIQALQPRFSDTVEHRPLALSAPELAAFKNLYLSTDLGRLDVLGSLPPIGDAAHVLKGAERFDVGGVEIRVIPLDVLIQVKAAMGRPKDKQVEAELRAIAEVLASRKK